MLRSGNALQKVLADRCQHNAKGTSLKESGTKFMFQIANTARYRGLGRTEMFRSGTQATSFSNCNEFPDLVELHDYANFAYPSSFRHHPV
jgi:hypothetical protein